MLEADPRPPASPAEGAADELEALRARVQELELELVEQAARANAAVAAAQARVYWLDRWNLDLNALMERPAARGLWETARTLVRFARGVKTRRAA